MARQIEYRTVTYYTDAARGLLVGKVNNARLASISSTGINPNLQEFHEYLSYLGREGWEVKQMIGTAEEGIVLLQRETFNQTW
jgi:hypothetical protein